LSSNFSNNLTSENATDRVKPLNTNSTNTTIPGAANITAVANATAAVAVNPSEGSITMVDELAGQFRLVYTASVTYNVKNLSATEMFQV
jgi:hypothetical protein